MVRVIRIIELIPFIRIFPFAVGGRDFAAEIIFYLFIDTHVEVQTALQRRTGIEHQVRLFGDFEFILPIDEHLYLMVGDQRATLRILVVCRIVRSPLTLRHAEGVVDTDGTTESGYITGVIDYTYFESVQVNRVAQ